jgi:NADH:ubiquinone oxidoreductase subunit K
VSKKKKRKRGRRRRRSRGIVSELLDFVIVSMVLVAVGIYGLVVKRNAIRMLFSIEIIANAANLLLVAFSRGLPNAQGQVVALFSIAIAAAEVAVGLGLIIVAYRLYKEIDVAELRSMRG